MAQDTNNANILYFCCPQTKPHRQSTCDTPTPTQTLTPTRGISSVGLERLLDRQEVTGSNPVYPTTVKRSMRQHWLSLFWNGHTTICERCSKIKKPLCRRHMAFLRVVSRPPGLPVSQRRTGHPRTDASLLARMFKN